MSQLSAVLPGCGGECAIQPLFQDSNATEAPFVQVVPVLQQVWSLRQRQILLKGAQDSQECPLLVAQLVSSEMNIETSPAQLRAQVTERQQIVGAKQDVDSTRVAGYRFDHI